MSSLFPWSSLLDAQELVWCRLSVSLAQLCTHLWHGTPVDIYLPFWVFTGPITVSFFLYLSFPAKVCVACIPVVVVYICVDVCGIYVWYVGIEWWCMWSVHDI